MALQHMQTGQNSIKSFASEQLDQAKEWMDRTMQWYRSQLQMARLLIYAIMSINLVIAVLFFVYHKQIINVLVAISDKWHGFRFGRAVLFVLIFCVSFPPLIGFSALSMLTGMVYGVPQGWPLLASALIIGSFCSLLVFRYVLHRQAVQLASRHSKFRALVEILSETNSLVLLVLIRLCPLPFSLSNGALAAVPELSAFKFIMASVITSPKLAVHLFVGHKIKHLGSDSSTYSKIIDLVSIIVTVIATSVTTYVIYKRMQRKLDEYSILSIPNLQHMIFGDFNGDLESMEVDMDSLVTDGFIIDEEEDEL